MPKCPVIAYRSGGHSERIMAEFAKGAKCELLPAERGLAPGEAAIWGLLRGSGDLLKLCMKERRRFYYVDHAYFFRGHPRSTYRIAISDLQATGPVIPRPDDRWQRWARDVPLQRWRPGGRHILICPPTDTVALFYDIRPWVNEVQQELRRYSDRPLVVRHKHNSLHRPLQADLSGCHAVVTHQSMVAVEAACAGVPVFVSEHSAAAAVGRTELAQIENPLRPEREPWLHHLAYQQFHLTEISDGTAWRILQETMRLSG